MSWETFVLLPHQILLKPLTKPQLGHSEDESDSITQWSDLPSLPKCYPHRQTTAAFPLCPTALHSSCHTRGTQPSCSRAQTAPIPRGVPAPHLTLGWEHSSVRPKAAFPKPSIPAGCEPSIPLLTAPAHLLPVPYTNKDDLNAHSAVYTFKALSVSYLPSVPAWCHSQQCADEHISAPELHLFAHFSPCIAHSPEQNSPQLSNAFCHATKRTAAAGQGAAVRHSGLHQCENKSTVSTSQQSRAVTLCLPSAFSGEVTTVQGLCSPTAFTALPTVNSTQLHNHSNSPHGGSPPNAAMFASLNWIEVNAVCAESNCTGK